MKENLETIKEMVMEHSLGKMGINMKENLETVKKNGHGTLTFANGNKYEGEWRDGKRNGQGTLYTKNFFGIKITKQGQWRNGEFIG